MGVGLTASEGSGVGTEDGFGEDSGSAGVADVSGSAEGVADASGKTLTRAAYAPPGGTVPPVFAAPLGSDSISIAATAAAMPVMQAMAGQRFHQPFSLKKALVRSHKFSADFLSEENRLAPEAAGGAAGLV